MSKKRNEMLKDKKMVYAIGIVLSIIAVISIILFIKAKKDQNEEKNISNLTTKYNEQQAINNKDKVVANTNIDSDTNEEVNIDDNEEIEEVTEPTYKPINISGLDESSVKREADDFSVFLSEHINNKSFDELYSNLNRDYKKEFKIKKDMFEFQYTFNNKISIEVTNAEMNKDKDRLIITAKLIESDGAFRIVDFTLFSDGTFADIPIYLSVDLPFKSEIDNVKYEINKRYDTRLGAIYNVDIENNSQNLIKITDMLIKNKEVIYTYKIVSDNTDLESYPGIPFNFKMKLHNNSDIDYVELKCEDYNGNPYSIVILDKNR